MGLVVGGGEVVVDAGLVNVGRGGIVTLSGTLVPVLFTIGC